MRAILLAAALALTGAVHAETASPDNRLAWDYDGTIFIDGFRLYCNDEVVWQGETLEAVLSATTLVPNDIHTCVVKAYNASGESAASNAVTFPLVDTPPSSPISIRIIK